MIKQAKILYPDLTMFLETYLNGYKTQFMRDRNGAELPNSVCRF